nr:methylated-DNA--protein-cysteine methyltransferase, inducible [Helicoverpa armigera]
MSLYKILAKFSKNSVSTVYVNNFESPVGQVTAAADDDFLYIVTFEDSKNFEKHFDTLAKELSCKYIESKNKVLEKFEKEFTDYIDGKLKNFTVPIKTHGSDFQKDVWNKLLELPYGSTQTYGDLAKALGRPPSHSRAVGAACGANALLVVVPCHRLIASGSKGGGYDAGVDRKDKLIQLEKSNS